MYCAGMSRSCGRHPSVFHTMAGHVPSVLTDHSHVRSGRALFRGTVRRRADSHHMLRLLWSSFSAIYYYTCLI